MYPPGAQGDGREGREGTKGMYLERVASRGSTLLIQPALLARSPIFRSIRSTQLMQFGPVSFGS